MIDRDLVFETTFSDEGGRVKSLDDDSPLHKFRDGYPLIQKGVLVIVRDLGTSSICEVHPAPWHSVSKFLPTSNGSSAARCL